MDDLTVCILKLLSKVIIMLSEQNGNFSWFPSILGLLVTPKKVILRQWKKPLWKGEGVANTSWNLVRNKIKSSTLMLVGTTKLKEWGEMGVENSKSWT